MTCLNAIYDNIRGILHSPVYIYSPKGCIIELSADVETGNSKLVSERKLTKTVISSKARNLIILKIQALKISPYSRNDKKRGFRSGTN